jgi:hypothetical protein
MDIAGYDRSPGGQGLLRRRSALRRHLNLEW